MCLNPIYLNMILRAFFIVTAILLGYDIIRTILFTKGQIKVYNIYKSSANFKFLILLILGIFLWLYVGNIYVLLIIVAFMVDLLFHTLIIKDGLYENGLVYDELFIKWSQVKSYEVLTPNKIKLVIERKLLGKTFNKTLEIMVKETDADLESFLSDK
ncbi:hypothetical protein [Vallitalea okinawensis]|uniref:hypothetical protein n=1 Tax=Vallitalea okinawensis TaxID=2078660 RepID=UPI000CFDED02|nr:hypothetical protein [Vallitalea okinawensis]